MSTAAASEKPSPPPNKLSKKAAGVVGLAVACSRVLGMIREMIFGALFGANTSMDMFVTAFRVPNLLRDLFAEGALSTAFITTFSRKIATEGDDSAWRLANKVATLAAVFISLVTLLGILLAPQLISVMASGFDAPKAEMTTLLTRIMFPFILLVSLAALAMGMLNARHVFGMPAMASSFFNLGSIIGGLSLAWWMDPGFGPRALIGLSIGTLIGGFLQLVVQFPSLRKVGFRFRPDFQWRDEGVSQILRLMGPAVIAASAVQVNVMVNTAFATRLEEGAVSSLNYAFRLMQLPLGMFGVAVATVTLPVVSRLASVNDTRGFSSTLARGVRLAFLLTIPSAVGLAFFAEPIISLLYQRGKFDMTATLQTAAALKYYAMGLVAYSGIKVLVPAFYAVDRRNLPMVIGFISIGSNYVLNQIFTFYLGFGLRGLALSTSLVALCNFGLLYFFMRRHTGRLDTRLMVVNLAKLALASIPLAAICAFSQRWFFADLGSMAFVPKLIAVLGTIGAAAGAFGAAVILLKVEEVQEVVRIVKRKLGRG